MPPAAPSPPPAPDNDIATPPTALPVPASLPPTPPGIPGGDPTGAPQAIPAEVPLVGPAASAAVAAAKPEKLLHIPCPNGHELECPRDMLGQDVLCPECNTQFALREKDSIEYKQRKKRERERKEKKLGEAWFNFAVVVVVVVVLGVIAMASMMWFGDPPKVETIPRRPPPVFGPQGADPDLESNPEIESNPASELDSTPSDDRTTPPS